MPGGENLVILVALKPDPRYGGDVPKERRVAFARAVYARDPEFALALCAAYALGGIPAARDVMFGALVNAGIFKPGANPPTPTRGA